MRKIKDSIMRFMTGRYGTDDFNKFLMILYLVLLVLNIIFKIQIFFYLSLIVVVFYFFRSFSKSSYKRQAENNQYRKIQNKVKKYFKLQKNKWRDRKTHVYRKCPDCKTVLRLPKKKGRHTCTCPQCRKSLDVTV